MKGGRECFFFSFFSSSPVFSSQKAACIRSALNIAAVCYGVGASWPEDLFVSALSDFFFVAIKKNKQKTFAPSVQPTACGTSAPSMAVLCCMYNAHDENERPELRLGTVSKPSRMQCHTMSDV